MISIGELARIMLGKMMMAGVDGGDVQRCQASDNGDGQGDDGD